MQLNLLNFYYNLFYVNFYLFSSHNIEDLNLFNQKFSKFDLFLQLNSFRIISCLKTKALLYFQYKPVFRVYNFCQINSKGENNERFKIEN